MAIWSTTNGTASTTVSAIWDCADRFDRIYVFDPDDMRNPKHPFFADHQLISTTMSTCPKTRPTISISSAAYARTRPDYFRGRNDGLEARLQYRLFEYQ